MRRDSLGACAVTIKQLLVFVCLYPSIDTRVSNERFKNVEKKGGELAGGEKQTMPRCQAVACAACHGTPIRDRSVVRMTLQLNEWIGSGGNGTPVTPASHFKLFHDCVHYLVCATSWQMGPIEK